MNAIQIAEIAESRVANKMQAYIEKVSKVYSLPLDDLQDLAKGGDKVERRAPCDKKLMKLKKKELQEKCLALGCKTTGNKSELVKRIVKAESRDPPALGDTSPPEIRVEKNAHGNYVYDSLVIDKGTKMVVGRELEDGKIGQLRRVDIDKCHQHKLQFAIPLNISEEEKVEDIEDDDCIEDEEEELEVDDEVEGNEDDEVEGNDDEDVDGNEDEEVECNDAKDEELEVDEEIEYVYED